jgi:hypothetical protein
MSRYAGLLAAQPQNSQKNMKFSLTFDKMACIITSPFEKGPESDLERTGRVGGREINV